MFSWFPMYFPLRSPCYVRAGETVTVDFWRKSDGKKVWYEWALIEPQISPIHNSDGIASAIRLQG